VVSIGNLKGPREGEVEPGPVGVLEWRDIWERIERI
jgi:hypothetical protein